MTEHLPYPFERLADQEQIRRSREFLAAVRTRRSIRSFSPDPVPFEVIENAIRAASLAPSGANRQPWRFVVVTDPAVKHEIRLAAEAEERENYQRRFPQEWLDALEPFATDWRKGFLEIAPVLIVVFRIDYGMEGSGPTARKVKNYYVHESVGIATGVLLTALHWSGVATLVHTPSPMHFLSRILERPPNERPYLLIPAGYPAPDATVPGIRKKSLEEVMALR